MAVGTYPKRALVKVFDTNEVIQCGRFKFTNSFELQYIRGLFLFKGLLAGTERFRFKIYTNSAYTKLLHTGDWSDVSDVEEINRTKTSWRGYVRGDFNKEWLSNQFSYYIGCEINGYTRNADTFYAGMLLDAPKPIHILIAELSYTEHPIAIEIYGPQKREI